MCALCGLCVLYGLCVLCGVCVPEVRFVGLGAVLCWCGLIAGQPVGQIFLSPGTQASRGLHADTAIRTSGFDTRCRDQQTTWTRVCSRPSRGLNSGQASGSSRTFFFKYHGLDVSVHLRVRPVHLPDMNVSFHRRSHPVYREELSSQLHVFYSGSLDILRLSWPFSAEWDGRDFVGRTILGQVSLEMSCRNQSRANFYLNKPCFVCSLLCSTFNTELKQQNGAPPNQTDAVDINTDYPDFGLVKMLPAPTSPQIRRTREISGLPPARPVSCVVHLVADQLFHQHVGLGSLPQTVNSMFSVLHAADSILRSTDLDGDGLGDNLGVLAGRVTVWSQPQPHLSRPALTARDYLQQLAYLDFSHACLGLAFTYRDFHGLAGSSFQAHSDDSLPGGICQRRLQTSTEAVSFNAAAITFLNAGQRLTPDQLAMILAHELGHSFGARHDSSDPCLTSEFGASYLMSPTINLNDQAKEARFSVCSIQSMLPVIQKKGSCLVQTDQTWQCGNTVPEGQEECDCGTSHVCHLVDPCCTPADVQVGPDKPCTLRRSQGKLCTPKVSPCCSDSCHYLARNETKLCSQLHECVTPSFCDGHSGHCPASAALPDGTLCNQGLQVCQQGNCAQGVCQFLNMTDCACTELANRCRLCCQRPGSADCEPVSHYGNMSLVVDILRPAGDGCYQQGVCDSFSRCQGATFLRGQPGTGFSFLTLSDVGRHLRNYWPYHIFSVLFGLFVVVVILLPYRLHQAVYTKALRYGKLLAALATGDHQAGMYQARLAEWDNYYRQLTSRLDREYGPTDYTQAVARLKLFFPEASTAELGQIARMSSTEDIAVQLLLVKGYKLRTLTASGDKWDSPV